MYKKMWFFSCVFALLALVSANGDWDPADGHKMHFPQLPNPTGWDVNATQPMIIADDWMCSETGWVKDIHFWGSWMHGQVGQVVAFQLSIHSDIPAGSGGIPYSRPGETLWDKEIPAIEPTVIVRGPFQGTQGWYDPRPPGMTLYPDHEAYYQYNVTLPDTLWFWQEEGTIYWLNISAIVVGPPGVQWGWKSTLDRWNDDGVWATWGNLNWIEMREPFDPTQSLNLAFVINGGPPDTCDYYKSRYLDYTPQGMPDFDQKQLSWVDSRGLWSHDGPAALANCIWWFDSKFEPNPVDPRPFGVTLPNDGYNLLRSYSMPPPAWDDHDPINVQPFISDLATNYLNTNITYNGTTPTDMQNGFRNYVMSRGLQWYYKDTLVGLPSYEYIRDQVLVSQDVILLLNFYEVVAQSWVYKGSHWVTVAGACTDQAKRQICISDPFLDFLEGEPPSGSAHGGTVHNDADNISGPHVQIQHDPYTCTQMTPPGGTLFMETINYPATPDAVNNFLGMNLVHDFFPWQGGTVVTAIQAALVICPTKPADADDDGIMDPIDNCPNIYNPGQEDADGDGVGDVGDNCPTINNPGQQDTDLDGKGDACDNCDSQKEILTNGDFEGGFTPDGTGDMIPNSWTKYETSFGGPGETSTLSKASDSGPPLPGISALGWLRSLGGTSGDWTACEQTLNYDVSACSCVTMTIDVKVLGHNLGGSGTTATEYEFPVTVVVYYTDVTGTPRYWQYGWYEWIDGTTGPNPNHAVVAGGTGVVTGLQVADSVWVKNSFDLMTELTNPATIDKIRVGGAGWDFEGMADNIQLLVCTPTCEYYKPPYVDYAPKGMPDFDQKQVAWKNFQQRWSHCGPAALADCFWWFDSKFEKPNPVPPPTVKDQYPLVQSYATMPPLWDDHDAFNVMPFVDSLALYCGTNMMPPPPMSGTVMINMAAGASSWLNKTGLSSKYTVNLVQYPPYELIYDEVHRSQDVILLLGFYEFKGTPACIRVGGHYVTVAGVCTTDPTICISDPYFDMNEGEPPAGSAHPSFMHNDAQWVSGPHGTIHHDRYTVTPPIAPCPLPGAAMLPTYPVTPSDVYNFENQNPFDPMVLPVGYAGGPVFTIIEGALVICPTEEPCDCKPGDANGDAIYDIADAVYLINYMFKSGVAPTPYAVCSGDANCDCVVDIADAVFLINYMFKSGVAPCTCDEWISPAKCGPPLR